MLFSRICRVSKFYHWSEDQVLNLTPQKFWAYSKEIGILQAEEQLRLINAIIFPKLPLNDRRRIMREYQKISDPGFKEKQQKQTEISMNILKAKFGYKGKR